MRPKAGDRVRVRATGETGTLITTRAYCNMLGGLQLKNYKLWAHTRWVRFDEASPNHPIVVGFCSAELEVIA